MFLFHSTNFKINLGNFLASISFFLKTKTIDLKMNQQNKGNNKNKMVEKSKLVNAETDSMGVERRYGLPAELLNELFASLPLENAFGILAKMPNWLLARNVRRVLKSIKMAMKGNKWDAEDCGPRLNISGEGLVVEHSGPNNVRDAVRAKLPISMIKLKHKKPSIAFYFEVEIRKLNPHWSNICIGFCTKQFTLGYELLGIGKHISIGIWSKGVMYIDGSINFFKNSGGFFHAGDVIGLGIVHFTAASPMKCFATLNGKLLGTFVLPAKFATLKLFPLLIFYNKDDSIRANFGLDEWRFNPSQF